MRATWAFWVGQPLYMWHEDWGSHWPGRTDADKLRYQTRIFMWRWRVIPLPEETP